MNPDTLLQIQPFLDPPAEPRLDQTQALERLLREAAYGPILAEFFATLYAIADAGTFCNGAFRIYPFHGSPSHGLPGLLAWNDRRGWKQFEPAREYDTFYFGSNSFGDLFGLPLNKDREIARPRTGVLAIEKYQYQEAGLDCAGFLSSMKRGNDVAAYFARLPEHDWAAGALGVPKPWQCFSSNVPVILGGEDTINNLAIQSLVVHVSFSLQVLRLHTSGGLKAGSPLPKVDLYDSTGNLLV